MHEVSVGYGFEMSTREQRGMRAASITLQASKGADQIEPRLKCPGKRTRRVESAERGETKACEGVIIDDCMSTKLRKASEGGRPREHDVHQKRSASRGMPLRSR